LGIHKAGKEEAKDVTAYMSEGGKQKAKLTSPYMQHETQDTAKMIFPKSLHVEFYDSTGKVESRLFAKFAINYENLRKVLLQDSVLVFNMIGDTMRTNELWWDQNRQLFYTDKNVHTKQQGNDIYSVGMTSDQAFKNIHFFQIRKSTLLVADSTMPAK
jgi:LPS export ABC transporter protein LptC